MTDTTETETDTNTNTDEPTKAELHDRVRKLESTVEKLMPSRRDALRMGAAGLAGAAGLGAASQSAEASTGSAGTIGSNSDRPDLFADEIDANNVTGVRQGCRVILSSDQSISQGNRTKIQFDSEVYDSGSNFDTSSHSWTCPRDGLYMANLQVRFEGGGNGQLREVIVGTAASELANNEGAFNRERSTDSSDRLNVSTINEYAQGDTIVGYAANFDSSDRLKSGDRNGSSFLEVAFLGGL